MSSLNVDIYTVILGIVAVIAAVGVWSLTRPSKDGARLIATYRAALKKDPHNTDARVEIGRLLLQTGQAAQAAHELRMAVDMDPKNARAHHVLGTALLSTGGAAAAFEHIQKATLLAPSFAAAHVSLGSLFELKNDLIAAKDAYTKAKTISPDMGIAHYNLARIYALQRNHQKAIGALEDAFACDPTLKEDVRSSSDFDFLLHNAEFQELVFGDNGQAKRAVA